MAKNNDNNIINDPECIKEKHSQLIKEIEEYNRFYYEKNTSKISDAEYDSLMQDLIELEAKYPYLVSDKSPTQKVSGRASNKFAKYEHLVPMLSLANAFSDEDLLNFDHRIKKEINKKTIQYYCEYKIDGISISLIYQNGKLVKAATRGDGLVGEDITKNVLQINSVPKTIPFKDDLNVRGEIFFTKENFDVLNIKQRNNNEKEFANARNAASGTLRQINSKTVKDRNLSIFCYFLNKKEDLKTQDKDLAFLVENNFPVNTEYNKLFNSIDEIIEYIKTLAAKREQLPYVVDGIVIKVNDHLIQKMLAETSKSPKWAIAYKFAATRKCTVLKNIFPTVGRTGKITFNASLEPVELAGSIIKSATLHNANYIIKNDIRIGDYVWIKKAGDIIPKVIKPEISKRSDETIKWEPIKNCPDCNDLLVKKNDGVDLYCVNPNCHKQSLRLIEHFVSKKAMNIQGVSKKLLAKLYKLGIVTSFANLYELENHRDAILAIDKIGKKMFENILQSVAASKKVSLDSFIYALGIPNVGYYSASLLANHFKSLDKIIKAKYSDLAPINDIGTTIADSLHDYFENKKNIAEINELIKKGVNIYHKESAKKFSNQIFVFTGKLSAPRLDYTNQIKNLGGHISSVISSKTNYLVIGEHPGSKFIKAQKLNVNIISEEALKKLLES